MEIFTVGDDKRLSFAKEALLREAGDVPCRVHLLPIPSSRDGGRITGTDLLLPDYLSGLCEGDLLVCYGLAEERIEALIGRGISVIDLAKDEDYIDEGAYLTAVATVAYLLKEARLSPSDTAVGVIGLGRIGRRLCVMLLALGYSVCAFSGRSGGGAPPLGCEVYPYARLAETDAPRLDFLINTAPAKILPPTLLPPLSSAVIIELASGENIPDGIRCVRLPSLPARALPEAAGRTVAKAVLRLSSLPL